MTDRMDTCASCRFFKAGPNECRRRAPIHADRSYVNQNNPEGGRIPEYVAEWPAVYSSDWCGDYEMKR